MSGTAADVIRARAEAAAARSRIEETIARLKNRLDPRVRARETWEDVRDKGEAVGEDALEFAYDRPRVVAGIAGGGVLFLLRRPIVRLLRRLIFWRRPKWDASLPPKKPARLSKQANKGGEIR